MGQGKYEIDSNELNAAKGIVINTVYNQEWSGTVNFLFSALKLISAVLLFGIKSWM